MTLEAVKAAIKEIRGASEVWLQSKLTGTLWLMTVVYRTEESVTEDHEIWIVTDSDLQYTKSL